MHMLLEMTAARSPPASTLPFAAGQVDDVLLTGDEGEVGRKQVLHHRRKHHARLQLPPLYCFFSSSRKELLLYRDYK
jgi:hypothetical protein